MRIVRQGRAKALLLGCMAGTMRKRFNLSRLWPADSRARHRAAQAFQPTSRRANCETKNLGRRIHCVDRGSIATRGFFAAASTATPHRLARRE